MATLAIPIFFRVRITLRAISPLFAINTFFMRSFTDVNGGKNTELI
jgi:hypothetical protein